MRNSVIAYCFLLLALVLLLAGCGGAPAGPTATSAPPAGAPTVAQSTTIPTTAPAPTSAFGPTMQVGTPSPTTPPSAAPSAAATMAPTAAPTAQATAPSAAPSPAPTTGAAAGTCNRALFVADITVPDRTVLAPGQSFNKIWRLRNTGTCTWGNGYRFAYVRGPSFAQVNSIAVPNTPPGANADLLVPMTAPTAPGLYTSFWRLRAPDGTAFGSEVWVTINVVAGLPPAANTLVPTPTP